MQISHQQHSSQSFNIWTIGTAMQRRFHSMTSDLREICSWDLSGWNKMLKSRGGGLSWKQCMQISDKSIQKTLGTMLGLLSLHDLILHAGLTFTT